MTTGTEERLYSLLPAVYRSRDADQGEALRALMAVIETELQAVEDNITGLYGNCFIETCDDWVIPYIGQMLGVRSLHAVEGVSSFSLRGYVANTIAYRRRKGTPAVLEQIAKDVTGWRSRVVEFFEILSTTQHMDHVRLDSPAMLDLTSASQLELLEGPFQGAAHTVDVRHINHEDGWYNIPNVGLFLWRLQPYFLEGAPPTSAGDGLYFFSPHGHDMPLFHRPETEEEITHVAEETNVPTPIRRLALHEDLSEYEAQYSATPEEDRPANSSYYGPDSGINIVKDGEHVPPIDVVSCNLTSWDRPAVGEVAVDVATGRLAFAPGEAPVSDIEVSYTYGFSGDIGAGPYDRFSSLAEVGPDTLLIEVAKGTAVSTIQAALSAWQTDGSDSCVIQIQDNGVYGGNIDVDLPAGATLVIEAANERRPVVKQVGNFTVSAPDDASLTLNGLLMEGAVELEGDVGLNLKHCTLVPGMRLLEDGTPQFPDRDSIVTSGAESDTPRVSIDHCIVGSIRLPAEAPGLSVQDSIIDACADTSHAIAYDDAGTLPGPPTSLVRTTVLGRVYVREFDLVSEALFTATAVAVRKQVGCVRFSYLPAGSETPRRFNCQPDRALDSYAEELGKDSASDLTVAEANLVYARLRPRFSSGHYGDPGYVQLSLMSAEEIRTGGADGSEIGAFEYLKQPQRIANLGAALQEYLPFGLDAGLIYVT